MSNKYILSEDVNLLDKGFDISGYTSVEVDYTPYSNSSGSLEGYIPSRSSVLGYVKKEIPSRFKVKRDKKDFVVYDKHLELFRTNDFEEARIYLEAVTDE